MTPMAQRPLKPSGPHVWPFIEDLTRCPSVCGYKRAQPGFDISGHGVVKPSCEVFFLRTPNKVTGPLSFRSDISMTTGLHPCRPNVSARVWPGRP